MPIDLNGTIYKLCLLDTNAVSEIVKHPSQESHRFFELKPLHSFIPCFSVFTILELRQRQDVYTKFLEMFSVVPCIILKTHEQMINEEINNFPNFSNISPALVGAPGILAGPDKALDKILDLVFKTKRNLVNESIWNQSKASVVKDIASMVRNFPPEKGKYSSTQIRLFVHVVGIQQIYLHSPAFAKTMVKNKKAIEIDAFPTIKMMAYTVFYKFYNDPRKPCEQDAFDLMISALTPYVDAVVTEAHQAEAVKKIKRIDHFLNHVEVLPLRDLRH